MRRSADQRLALRGPKPSNHTLTGESRFDDRDEIPFEERLRLFLPLSIAMGTVTRPLPRETQHQANLLCPARAGTAPSDFLDHSRRAGRRAKTRLRTCGTH
jgi:hypothetical protein